MADNVTVPLTGTGDSTALVRADERTIGGNTVKVQSTYEIGGTSIATGRATATTTSGSIISARDTRKVVILRSLPSNTDVVDVGPSGATSGSDFPLSPGDSVSIPTTAAIHADAASGSQVIAYIEVYE